MVQDIVYDGIFFGDDALTCKKKEINKEIREVFVSESGSMSHMVNILINTKNIIELKIVVKTGNNKTTIFSLQEDWKGYQKRDSKFYMVTCTDKSYISYLDVSIFSVAHAFTKASNMASEKDSLILNKNKTILKFEERLDHGNCDSFLLAARLYTIINKSGKWTRKARIRKVTITHIWKGPQGLQPTQ